MHGLGSIYLGPVKQLSTSLPGIAQVMHLLLNQSKEYHNQNKKSSSGQTAQAKATGMAITADLPPKPLVPLEMFSNGNCLDKTQDTEFKKKIKFIREFKQFEENRIKNTPLNSKKITINA